MKLVFHLSINNVNKVNVQRSWAIRSCLTNSWVKNVKGKIFKIGDMCRPTETFKKLNSKFRERLTVKINPHFEIHVRFGWNQHIYCLLQFNLKQLGLFNSLFKGCMINGFSSTLLKVWGKSQCPHLVKQVTQKPQRSLSHRPFTHCKPFPALTYSIWEMVNRLQAKLRKERVLAGSMWQTFRINKKK